MRGWRAFAAYSLSRLALFAAVLAGLYLIGLRGPGVVLLAVLVSGIGSYFFLRRQRTALAVHVEDAVRRRQTRWARRTAGEDEIADRLIAEQHRDSRR
jgi:Protein of unknown function (DUF4229)